MNVIDIRAHIYERATGVTRGQPTAFTDLERVAIGNEEVQFLSPSFEQSRGTAGMFIVYMDWYGIEKAVLMPNPHYRYHNRYFVDSVKRYLDRLRGVVLIDIMKGQEVARELAPIHDQEILFGFKVEVDSIFQCTPGVRLSDSGLSPAWNCCNQYHQPVFIHIFRTENIEGAGFLASAYPDISFILCHMGTNARFKKGMPESNYREVLDLVRDRSNVFIDTSIVPVYFGKGYPWPSPVKIIQACCRHVGPGKMMWMLDYPGMPGHGAMQQLINLAEEHCNRIPESHRQMIMANNTRRLFFDNQR